MFKILVLQFVHYNIISTIHELAYRQYSYHQNVSLNISLCYLNKFYIRELIFWIFFVFHAYYLFIHSFQCWANFLQCTCTAGTASKVLPEIIQYWFLKNSVLVECSCRRSFCRTLLWVLRASLLSPIGMAISPSSWIFIHMLGMSWQTIRWSW